MSPAQATVEVFWTAYMTLSPDERTSLIDKIMKNDELFEDYLDNRSVDLCKDEPSIPVDEYIKVRMAV